MRKRQRKAWRGTILSIPFLSMQNACCFLCHYSSDIIADWCGLCFSHSKLYNLASTLHPMALLITCMIITLLHRFWQTYVLVCLQLLMIPSVCNRCVELHYTDVDGVSLIPMARGMRLWLCTCGMVSINAILCRDILSVWSFTAMMASKCEQANVNLFVLLHESRWIYPLFPVLAISISIS